MATIEQMVKELESAGWTRYHGLMTTWQCPHGELFRGPAKAYELMLKFPKLSDKGRQQ